MNRLLPSLFAALVTGAAFHAAAQGDQWTPLGTVHDRIYAMNRPSLAPIDGGFAFGVFSDKAEAAPADPLPNGKAYRSSFLNVEVNCARKTFRIASARFFSESQARGAVVSEDSAAPGEGWAPAQPGTIGESFVAAACTAP